MTALSVPTIPSQHLNFLDTLGLHPVTIEKAANYKDISQNSKEWSEIRSNTIGASEIAMIAGSSEYGNGDVLLKNKFGIVVETVAMKRWRELEEACAQRYKKVVKRASIRKTGVYAHPDYGFLTASPDRLQFGPDVRLVELKTCHKLPQELPLQVYHQVVMQMAVTDTWFFKEHNATPRASILYMDASEKEKMFSVEWDDAAKKAWFEDLLPRACVFYYTKFIPAIKKYRNIVISPSYRSPSMHAATASLSPLSLPPPSRTESPRDDATPGPSSALAEIPETSITQQTPAFVAGKLVYDVKQGKEGVIAEVVPCGKKARVDWIGEGPSKKPRSLEGLVVKPIKDSIPPNLHGQRVLVNSGGRKGSSLVGKKGTVKEMKATKCVVELDDKTTHNIEIKHLHRLEGRDEQPTVKLNAMQRIKVKDFYNWLRDYQEKSNTQLINVPNEESFRRSVAEFSQIYKLKY